jgi:hypothetical protein
LVQVALILAQLWMTVGVTCPGMWTHTFLPGSIPLEWGKPWRPLLKSATELAVSLSSTWDLRSTQCCFAFEHLNAYIYWNALNSISWANYSYFRTKLVFPLKLMYQFG